MRRKEGREKRRNGKKRAKNKKECESKGLRGRG